MKSAFLGGIALAFSASLPGQAQPIVAEPTPGEPAIASASVASMYSPGMQVTDANGNKIGVVTKVERAYDGGVIAIAVKVGGRLVHISPLALNVSHNDAIINMNVAEVIAAADGVDRVTKLTKSDIGSENINTNVAPNAGLVAQKSVAR